MNGIRAKLAGAAVAVAVSLSLLGSTAPAMAQEETVEVENWATFHGCIVTIDDEYVVMRTHGAGRGPNGLHRFTRTVATEVDTNVNDDACVAVVAWQENGEWYAASITAEHDGEGTVEVTRRRRGGE